MVSLDETDREILAMLQEDARRPYREIADAVGLTAPTISDRIERMEDLGVIRGFTVALDRSTLSTESARLLEVAVQPGAVEDVASDLATASGVEQVVRTEGTRIFALAHLAEGPLRQRVQEAVGDGLLSMEVRGVAETIRESETPIGEFDLTCVECGNPVGDEGVSVSRDGRRYPLCCPSCEELFLERYDALAADAE